MTTENGAEVIITNFRWPLTGGDSIVSSTRMAAHLHHGRPNDLPVTKGLIDTMKRTTKDDIYNALPSPLQPWASKMHAAVQCFLDPNQYNRKRDPFEDLSHVLNAPSPVIVDGGAYVGTTVDKFLKSFPDPTIHAFEPLPEKVRRLEHKYSSRTDVQIHENALGSSVSTVSLNVLNSPDSSSVFAPSEQLQDSRGSDNSYDVKETVEVSQVRLDHVVDQVDAIKLDLQGYELEALKGSEEILDSCSAILSEVEFLPYYEEQPLFSDVAEFLQARGFKLYYIYRGFEGSNGRLHTADVLYIDNEKEVGSI